MCASYNYAALMLRVIIVLGQCPPFQQWDQQLLPLLHLLLHPAVQSHHLILAEFPPAATPHHSHMQVELFLLLPRGEECIMAPLHLPQGVPPTLLVSYILALLANQWPLHLQGECVNFLLPLKGHLFHCLQVATLQQQLLRDLLLLLRCTTLHGNSHHHHLLRGIQHQR